MNGRSRTIGIALVTAGLVGIAAPPVVAGAAEKLQRVIVANDVQQPLPTVEIGEPVQASGWLLGDGSINFNGALFEVPAGKVLRVDHVSFVDSTIAVPFRSVTLTVTRGDLDHIFAIPVHPSGSVGDAGSVLVVGHGDPGTAVWGSAHTEDAVPPGAAVWMSFSGVLLDA